VVPRLERPFWVVEQFEVVLFDGVLPRLRSSLRRVQRRRALRRLARAVTISIIEHEADHGVDLVIVNRSDQVVTAFEAKFTRH
jgi:hypothetical protein